VISRGASWLVQRTAHGSVFESAPIGLYFAKLWYTERLYPIVFTVSALQNAMSVFNPAGFYVDP